MRKPVKTKTFESTAGKITYRRISWATFYKIRPDRKPTAANDNMPAAGAAAFSKAA